MKKKYTKKQITEAIAYWEKQLKNGNYKKLLESQYSSLVKIEVYDVEFLDVGTTTDIAQSEYKSVQIDVNINKSISIQIENWFDLNAGVLPISYKFKTLDSVKCKDYDKLKMEN